MGDMLAPRLLLASVLLVVLLSVGSRVGADELQASGYVFFWSSQGPVAVERDTEISPSDVGVAWAEELLSALLLGPTATESEEGLGTAIPRRTMLTQVVEEPDGTVVVYLEWPLDTLPHLTHESFEIIVNQIGRTLLPYNWRDLQVVIRGPAGTFVPLADFLPEIAFSPKETFGDTSVTAAGQAAQAPLPGQGQPTGALTGRTVYVSAGHGWEWTYDGRCGCQRWKTQRPPYPNHPSYPGPIIEDHNNAEAVNQYLLQYLWNAGAMVWPARERSLNPAEVIIINDALAPGTGYEETGQWATTGETGTGYAGTDYRWAQTVSGSPTATATWSAPLPHDGQYPVYVWYRPGINRAQQARYIVHHAGGSTTIIVDQRNHGNTWHYLGTYGFLSDQEARVTLTNQSNAAGQAVIADSVRFGGGTFDDLSNIGTSASYPPDKPWWEVSAFYYTQKMGMPAPSGDITARPIYARWEHGGTGDDAVFLSYHTNGWTGWNETIRGTETYAHNGAGKPRTEGSLELRNAIHSQLIHDIRAGWDPDWIDRGQKMANFGELRELWDPDPSARMPGTLIEVAFHDHPEDTDALKDPQFNLLVARALYKGIVRYYEQRDGISLPLLPEPPTGLRVQNLGDGALYVSWEPSPTDDDGLLGDAPTGYRVYTSSNGIGWSDGQLVTDGTSLTLTGLPSDEVVYVRVAAVNDGGESFATETLAARTGDPARVLLVNAFTRLDHTVLVGDHDLVEGYNERMLLDQMNRYDYVIQHAELIPYPFDSAANESLKGGTVSLDDYQLVIWILGQESYYNGAMGKEEQALLRDHLGAGGALFISGSEIAWTLDNLGDPEDQEFCRQYLRAAFSGDNAETWEVDPVPGSIFDGIGHFRFDEAGMYFPKYPDQFAATHGSAAALTYQGGRGGIAAVQYADGCERVVTFGFPFETIEPEKRPAVMERVLDFLDECLDRPSRATISSPEDGSAHNQIPSFQGSGEDYGGGLQRVEVQVERRGDGLFWDGAAWTVESTTWITTAGTTSWSYSLPGDLADDVYELRARACPTTDECTSMVDQVEFIFDTVPPDPTQLITPTGGVTLEGLRVELQWNPVEQDGGSEIGYEVSVNGRVYVSEDSTYPVWLRGSGPHEWKVEVVDRAGNRSGPSNPGVFYLDQSGILDSWLPLVLRQLTP